MRRVVKDDCKKFDVVYADPPWCYDDELTCGDRGIVHKYDLMSTNEIAALNVSAVCAENCMLHLWAVPPMIEDAMKVMEAWGFRYVTFGFAWIKLSSANMLLHWGMGHWTRGNVEPCLLGVKGKPGRASKAVHQPVVHPVDPLRATRKPGEVRRRIEMLSQGVKRLELFATEVVPGWTCVGYGADGRDVRDFLAEV